MNVSCNSLIISCCGKMCADCSVYIATERDDDAMKRFLAHQFSALDGAFTPDKIYCHGCHSNADKDSVFKSGCSVRKCCLERKIRVCAECNSFPCNTICEIAPDESEHRSRLDEMNNALKKAE